MRLTKAQKDLISSLESCYTSGLSEHQTSTIRQQQQQQQRRNNNNSTTNTAIDNTLTPPLNCPSWACVILPCINHLPSMKLFKLIQPHDAEVLRESRWVCYDAISLMVGDIIRLTAEDVVPADCIVLSLGMDHCTTSTTDYDDEQDEPTEEDEVTELVVDVHNITGEVRPKSIIVSQSTDSTIGGGKTLSVDSQVELYCGSYVLEGSAIAIVTHIGSDTTVARWMKEGKWPPEKKARNGSGCVVVRKMVWKL